MCRVSNIIHCQYRFPLLLPLILLSFRDPAILRFPNKLFYGNRIISDESVKNRHPKVIRPFGFVDTRGSQEEREKYSVKNAQEAAIIRSLLRNEEEVTKLLGQNAKVVVITPYKAQKKLLEDELSKVATLNQWCVSTVDSFQGQEADIVILSTVRTEAVGFVDNPQRLNVALTRAKRLMIVVGNKQLFRRLKSSSILQKLSAYADKMDGNFTVDIKTNIYSMPDWRNKTLWKALINAHFHNCIKKIAEKSKKDYAVVWNVIYTLALPEVSCLVPRPNPKSFWQVTSFSKHPQCSIVWVGKTGMSFEVHFAGSREECLRFIQLRAENVPVGSCKVSSDMLSLINDTVNEKNDNTTFTPSWETTNVIQKAIFEHKIEHLPLGTLKLDPDQQLIASQQPPLILESRSGTGKTNVLFQHALNFARELGDNRKFNDICFITVSKRLSSNLKARYDEIWKIESEPLQGCIFLSLSDFLDGLAKLYNLPMNTGDCKTFNEYMFHRKSHVGLKTNLNVQLIENEIGGVILGSLRSAQLCRPLSWTEYKDDKRSNIVADNATKHDIYSQYELYKKWKQDHGYFDVYDMVLELIKKLNKKPQQFFSGVYLDEVSCSQFAPIS
jgi:Superfamily I DNA and RNA helicases and helicase subunits